MQKIILFSEGFNPKEEFIQFVTSLGYTSYKTLDCRFNPKIIEFVEQRLEKYSDYQFYKGVESTDYMCGFEGVCYIHEVDTSRKWSILKQPPSTCYSKRKIKLAGLYEDVYYVDLEETAYNNVSIKYTT